MIVVGLLFDILSWICLISGSVLAVVGGIGIIRLPDFYTRLHGSGITDTLGAGLVMVGLMLQSVKVGVLRILEHGLADGVDAGPWLVTVKLMMILFFLLITSPTACHALAQAAIMHGVEPQLSETENGQSQ